MTTKQDEWKLEIINKNVEQMMPKLGYHNYRHIKDVEDSVVQLAEAENVSQENIFLLRTGAKLHDWGYIVGRTDNEERATSFAQDALKSLNYTNPQIKQIGDLIMATKMPQRPNTHLEMLLCDADLDYLGRKDFFEIGEGLRQELGITDEEKWYKLQVTFLQNHSYHTEIARKFRDAGKQENLAELKKILTKKYGI